MGFESIADFRRTSTIETAETYRRLRIGCNSYVHDNSTRSHDGAHNVISKTAKHIMLQMTAEMYCRGKIVSPMLQMKALCDETPLFTRVTSLSKG